MLDEKLLQEVWEYLENKNNVFLETGFEDLDSIMCIPEKKGALITIGARPAMGKTTFMLTIMENILSKKKKVLYFSFERTKEQLIRRCLFQKAEVSVLKSATNRLNKNDWENLANALNDLTEWDLTLEDNCLDITQIEAIIKECMPEFVFIDYLQLISGSRKKDRYSQIEDIYINLKRISKIYGITIFVKSQLSRAVESRCDKRPMLSDLRESGAIENISDVVIFLYRDEYYYFNNDDQIRKKGEAEIIVAKNKFGACGIVYANFRSNIPKFYPYLRCEDYDLL